MQTACNYASRDLNTSLTLKARAITTLNRACRQIYSPSTRSTSTVLGGPTRVLKMTAKGNI